MAVNSVLVAASRSICYVVLLLCLTALGSWSNAQPSPPRQGCADAQVIEIYGGWIANPGGRALGNWSCVSAGEELVLANDSTLVY
jgi:hypothetical protein